METSKHMNLCLKLFALASSDHGDGVAASLKLQERMVRHGIGFYDLLDHARRHVGEYGYQAEHFFSLMGRVQAATTSAATYHSDNPTDSASQSSGESRVQVREHTRTSRKGRTFTVRAHWRHGKCSADRYDWRKDFSADPGPDYEWVEGHERWHCHKGRGRKIRVRGYWRRKAGIAVKKAA